MGILIVLGLSAKNPILDVESATTLIRQGKSTKTAAVEAAAIRLRPIVMTSLTFLLGVLTQAHQRYRLPGGTLLASTLGVFFIPVFFVFINGCSEAGATGWTKQTGGNARFL